MWMEQALLVHAISCLYKVHEVYSYGLTQHICALIKIHVPAVYPKIFLSEEYI